MTKTVERSLLVFLACGLAVMLVIGVLHYTNADFTKEAENQGMPSKISTLMQAATEHPNDANVQLELAKAFLEKGDTKSAERFANIASSLNPSSPYPLYMIGYIRHMEGNNKEAVHFMELSIRLLDQASVHMSLGVIYKNHLHQVDKAIEHWEKALKSPDCTAEIQQSIQNELRKIRN